jgi:hypothetical protein
VEPKGNPHMANVRQLEDGTTIVREIVRGPEDVRQ